VCKKFSLYNVQSQLQESDVIRERLFLLLYLTGRTIILCRAWPTSDN